jgi:hypothetical protein
LLQEIFNTAKKSKKSPKAKLGADTAKRAVRLKPGFNLAMQS